MSLTYDAVFPTIIGKCERQDLLTNVQEILDSIDKDEYFEYSNGQTFDILPTLLKKEFEKEFINFLKVVLKINCDVQLTTSWFTHKSAGRHSHVNSWWSAVYYLVEDSEIEFTTKATAIHVDPVEYNFLNSLDVTYRPNVGDMLIFPSGITHTALDYKGSGERHSLAMNFMPKGQVGFLDSSFTYKSIL